MIKKDYQGGRVWGGQNVQKSDCIICESFLMYIINDRINAR